MIQEVIDLREGEARQLFGPRDRTLRVTREAFGVNVYAREGALVVEGEPGAVRRATRVFGELLGRLRSRGRLEEPEVLEILHSENVQTAEARSEQEVFPALDARFQVTPRTRGQAAYVQAMKDHDVVFAVGPAGTGKTYLATAMAILALRKGLFRKMVLARPAVEAGEKLGFLPGDFQAKVSPYLRPLYDALHDLLNVGQVRRYMEQDVIEVIPLAYMRGRTLDRAFIILDEAQNTSRLQMKMVLTRLGQNSKIVITGDETQIDLPPGVPSGLIHARTLLRRTPGVGVVELTREDIVRHRVVQAIVDAYEAEARRLLREQEREGAAPPGGPAETPSG